MDGLVASDLHQLDRFGVTWLKANRGTGSDIETVAVSFDPIEFKLRIRFNKVIM